MRRTNWKFVQTFFMDLILNPQNATGLCILQRIRLCLFYGKSTKTRAYMDKRSMAQGLQMKQG